MTTITLKTMAITIKAKNMMAITIIHHSLYYINMTVNFQVLNLFLKLGM